MPYDTQLASRVEKVLKGRKGITSKKMFGGLAFLANGNMSCGIIGDKLVVRVDKGDYQPLLKRKDTAPMDFTGRPLTGYIYVMPGGTRTDAALRSWVVRGIEFARTLPSK